MEKHSEAQALLQVVNFQCNKNYLQPHKSPVFSVYFKQKAYGPHRKPSHRAPFYMEMIHP